MWVQMYIWTLLSSYNKISSIYEYSCWLNVGIDSYMLMNVPCCMSPFCSCSGLFRWPWVHGFTIFKRSPILVVESSNKKWQFLFFTSPISIKLVRKSRVFPGLWYRIAKKPMVFAVLTKLVFFSEKWDSRSSAVSRWLIKLRWFVKHFSQFIFSVSNFEFMFSKNFRVLTFSNFLQIIDLGVNWPGMYHWFRFLWFKKEAFHFSILIYQWFQNLRFVLFSCHFSIYYF